MKKLLLTILALLVATEQCFAVPSVVTVTGSVTYGGTVTYSGAGFGTKPVQQKTYFIANGEDAAAGVAGSTWCVTSTFGNIQNIARVTTNCFEGAGCFGKGPLAMDVNNNQTASVSHTDVGFGGKLIASWVWYLIGSPINDTQNWKTWRWYSNFAKNNIYGGQQADGGFVNLVENALDGGVPTNGINRYYTADVEPEFGSHEQVEIQMKLNSTGNATDGILRLRQGSVQNIDSSTFQSNTTNDTAQNGRYNLMFPIHMVWTGSRGGSFNADQDFRYDDIMIDTSWCQAWFTTNSTDAAGGNKMWLAVQTWADGSITAIVPFKATAGTQFYAYARNNDGTINANGFPVTFGGSGAPGDPPAILTPEPDVRSTTIFLGTQP